MPFNLLTENFIPVLRPHGASVIREKLSLTDVISESANILTLDVEPVFELGILDYGLALLQRSMAHAGMIPTDVNPESEARSRAALKLVSAIRGMSLTEKKNLLENYSTLYRDRFDITDRRNFGQSPTFVEFPKKLRNQDNTKSFYHAREIKHGCVGPLDASHSALVILSQRHTAIRGKHSVPDGSDVRPYIGTANSGTLLLGPVTYVRGRTLWDTLLLQLTPDIIFTPEHDVPWWEKEVPTQVPNLTGTAVSGAVSLLTHTPRLLLIDFDEQNTITNAMATPGDLQTLEQRKNFEQKMVFFDRVRTTDNKDTGAKKGDHYISSSPNLNESLDVYGSQRLLAWEGISAALAVGDTSSDIGNRSLHWAACVLENIDMPENDGPLTIRTVTAVFDTKYGSKLSGIVASDLDLDLSLLMLDDPESLVSVRGELVVSAVRNVMKAGYQLKLFANTLHNEKVGTGKVGIRLQRDFLLSLDPNFRKWLSDFPLRPDSGEADSKSFDHMFDWNKNLIKLTEDAMFEYLTELPASAWSIDDEDRRAASVFNKHMWILRRDIPVSAESGNEEPDQKGAEK